MNNPVPLQNAIGNRTASPGDRDAARRLVIRLRADLKNLEDENRRLREQQGAMLRAQRGGAIDPALDHTAHANGGYDAYYWKLEAQLWSTNIPNYDRTARALADAEAAADQINAWQGFR